jgi:hypothetical protein
MSKEKMDFCSRRMEGYCPAQKRLSLDAAKQRIRKGGILGPYIGQSESERLQDVFNSN